MPQRMVFIIIIIKGKREDRIEVRESAGMLFPVVARVPNGISVKFISEEQEWYKIELPDGKQEFVQKNQVEH